jgi:hypothetical protein
MEEIPQEIATLKLNSWKISEDLTQIRMWIRCSDKVVRYWCCPISREYTFDFDKAARALVSPVRCIMTRLSKGIINTYLNIRIIHNQRNLK